MKKPRFSDTDRYRNGYAKAADHKEGYLTRKWDRTHPGWRSTKPKTVETPVIQMKRRKA